MTEHVCDVAVIGGGPAGLFAAQSARALAPHARVVVFDHSSKSLGKLRLAGGGRGNFTHDGSIKVFPAHYGAAASFVRKTLYAFNNGHLRTWFEERGVNSQVEAGGKVYPTSGLASDLCRALEDAASAAGVTVLRSCTPRHFACEPEGTSFFVGNTPWKARAVILAVGGASYPTTGSDGSFFSAEESLFALNEVPVVPFSPGLTPLRVDPPIFDTIEGVTLPDVSFHDGSHELARGSMLVRGAWLSGPAALDASRQIRAGQTVVLSCLPAYTTDALAGKLLRGGKNSRRALEGFLCDQTALPKRIVAALVASVHEQGILAKEYARELSRHEWHTFAEALTALPLRVAEKGSFKKAMVSTGGLALSGVDARTLALKGLPGWYACGECLDVTGDTGGYNLQWAFSSGYRAGTSAVTS